MTDFEQGIANRQTNYAQASFLNLFIKTPTHRGAHFKMNMW